MNISYRKILNRNQMILSDFNIESFNNNYLVKMITNNSIKGLLPSTLNMINSLPSFCYDITSKHALSSFTESSKIDFGLLSSILLHLHGLCENLENYMLDTNYILLSPHLIFLNPELKIPHFCYCPVCEKDTNYSLSNQLKILLDFIISRLDYNDKECVALAYTLHQKCTNNIFSTDDLICTSGSLNFTPDTAASHNNSPPEYTEYLIPETDNAAPETASDETAFYVWGLPFNLVLMFSGVIILSILLMFSGIYFYIFKKTISWYLFIALLLSGPVIFLLSLPYFISKRKYYSYLNDSINNPADGDTKTTAKSSSVIMPIGDTVLINHQPQKAAPRLVYTGNDSFQDIFIDTFPFTIGKMPDTSDCIIENSLISRIHARFYFKDNSYYVEDMHSSNGTCINDSPILPHTMTEINDGDFITFAHLTYIFKLC